MKIGIKIVLVLLVFLATSSGITKIMLMPQDVAFFSEYGFSTSLLMAFGGVQLVGGVMMIFPKTRFPGAALVAITFIISAIILIMAGKFTIAVVTFVTILLLGLIMKQNFRNTVITTE